MEMDSSKKSMICLIVTSAGLDIDLVMFNKDSACYHEVG